MVLVMFNFFFPELTNLIKYEKENFILEENKFSRNREMSFEDHVYYIWVNKGKTAVLEIDDYYYEKYGVDKLPVSKQAISKQRQYLDPLIFKEANKRSIEKIYSSNRYTLKDFKGHMVIGIDGSQADIPNTPITKEEFEVEPRGMKDPDSPKARMSVLSDLKNDFVIDSIISPFKIGESQLAFKHIENVSETIDLTKTIIIYDRAYASTELIMQLLEKNSKFIFRLKKTHYKKERANMKSDDEFVDINLNASRIANIKDDDLKEKAKETDFLNVRIVNIEIKPGVIETLLTNIPENLASTEELKELYGERWEIEMHYNVMKNRLDIENFSGKKLIIIEQDFYSQILTYNMLVGLKTEYNKKLEESGEYPNYKYEYKFNINILAGKLKTNAIRMVFAENLEEIEKIEQRMYISAKRYLRKVTEKPTTKRKKKPKRKYPYNNRKNF